ncbi:Piwi domain-containing protein [Mycena latifolia]|nr:Piwi domain-containing protein [Mycena latifolia]
MKRQRLIHALQTTVRPNVFQPRGIYDGSKILYATHAINGSYRVHGSNQNAAPDARGWYDIKISRTSGREIVPAQLSQLMVQGRATSETITAATLLQLLLSQAANLIYPNNGRAYFSSDGKMQIQGMAVELWRGFFQAVRPSVGRILVNVDTTVAAMYMSGPLIEVGMAVLGVRDARGLALRDARSEDFKKLERHLKNRLITVKTNNKSATKTVRGLVPGPVGRFEFQRSGTGPTTTVGEYYYEAHSYRLQYPDTIGVVTSGKSAPFKVVIPLELCSMNPGQLYKKKLPPQATTAVVTFAAMRPADRLRMIRMGGGGGPDQLRSPVQEYPNSEFMMDAGMRVDPNAITVQGRLLKVPSLVYGPDGRGGGGRGNIPRLVEPRDGAWNVLGSRFYTPQSMLKWGVANFDRQRITPALVNNVIKGLVDCCTQLAVAQPGSVQTASGHGSGVKQTLVQICRELGGPKEVDMIVCLLPSKADELRTLVKYTCDIELGVRSQCLREQKIQKANNQYHNNVALKLNARLGGSNALVDSPALKEVTSKPFMIMGMDVAHPAPGSNRPSVVSLVWSHDMHATAYCASTRVQEPRTELVSELKELVKEAVMMWGNKHKRPPVNIYFYRDGVSEGEYAQVQAVEIAAINEAFDEVWIAMKVPGPKPKLMVVAVGKRHHVSFFPPTAHDPVGDKTGNCRAGLVVDKGLASPQFPDFYLQSHAAIKGTSRSGHYVVLHDDIFGGNISKIQELSFALCHIYAKATRSVSIPAPVYCASSLYLACARGKFHVDPASDMDIDGSTTTGATGDKQAFDLSRWQDAYSRVNVNVQGTMYFL